MSKGLLAHLLAGALLPCLAAGANSPVYANSKSIQVACDTAWPSMLSAVTKNGFIPELSDRAGGVLKARYTRGPSIYRAARTDMEALTVKPLSRWTVIERFQVQSLLVTVTPSENTCSLTLQVQYAASRNNLLENGWIGLESNGRLESMILAEIDHIVAGAVSPLVPQNNPEARARQKVPVPFADAHEGEKSKIIVVRFTSVPTNAEVQVDGEYWGTTPTAALTRLPAGSHTILVKKQGYQDWERKITVGAGEDRTINAELQVESNDGTKPHIVGLQ